MHQKWYHTTELKVGSLESKYFYAMETIEVSRLSALAFLAAVFSLILFAIFLSPNQLLP